MAISKIPAAEPTKNISPTYSSGIHGWDFSWLELLVARLCPSSSHSSSSNQHKSQPCISGEYVGMIFLAGSDAGIFGVAMVLLMPGHHRTASTNTGTHRLKTLLKEALVGRSRSMVARTSKCELLKPWVR